MTSRGKAKEKFLSSALIRASISDGRVPQDIAAAAATHGITDNNCLFCAQSDINIDGSSRETWLVVSTENTVVVVGVGTDEDAITGPFELNKIQKIRTFQSVGSGALQFMIDDCYLTVILYSNAKREVFARVKGQFERLLKGLPFQRDALLGPSNFVCEECGLPLPSRGSECPRCQHRAGLMLRSLGLMRPYLRTIIFLFVVMLMGVALDLLPAQLTRILVDRVILPREHADWLPLILLGLVLAMGCRHLLNIVIGRASAAVGTRITKDLRERLHAKLMLLSVDYYDRHSVGSLMSRVLYDVDYFQGFVAQVAQGFLLNVMLIFCIGAVLFVMKWELALLVLLPIPFVVAGTIFFWHLVYPLYNRLRDSQSKMAQFMSGFLSGIRLVKAFGQEDRERDKFVEYSGYMRASRRKLESGTATFNPIMAFIFGLGGLVVWYAGGKLVLADHLSLGTLMAFFGYLGMFYAPISAISMFSNWLTGFMSATQRVYEILDAQSVLAPSKKPVRLPDMKGGIEFREVVFGYDPYIPVLKEVSFTIEPGQFVGVVGKSGSGKTTIVNLICRFYDVQSGQVLVDGIDVRDIDPSDLHRQICLVLQEPFLFRGSIADNIAYGCPDASPLAIMDAAKAANAHLFTTRRASAYDTRLGERGAGLSGGERQRVSIARALLCNPRVLVLDEATSSVDTESEQEIQKALTVACKNRTTIAIAHRLSTLKNAQHILVLDSGRIVEAGAHDVLMGIYDGVYAKLVKIQTELSRLET